MALAHSYQINVHQMGLTVAWSLILNISVIAAVLKYDKRLVAVHALFGWIILILTYVIIFFLLFPYGFNVF